MNSLTERVIGKTAKVAPNANGLLRRAHENIRSSVSFDRRGSDR